jgi:hypothetical protein
MSCTGIYVPVMLYHPTLIMCDSIHSVDSNKDASTGHNMRIADSEWMRL